MKIAHSLHLFQSHACLTALERGREADAAEELLRAWAAREWGPFAVMRSSIVQRSYATRALFEISVPGGCTSVTLKDGSSVLVWPGDMPAECIVCGRALHPLTDLPHNKCRTCDP